MGEIKIPAGEKGTTRIFSLSMSGNEARRLRDDTALQQGLLGTGEIDPQGIEVFPITDLGDIGLVGYLKDGIDAREADLRRDRAKLAGLDGWVFLLHSTAFGMRATTLNPKPQLTLIGTYAQTPADNAPIELHAETAHPDPDGRPQPQFPASPRSRGGSMVVVILGVLLALGLWLALR